MTHLEQATQRAVEAALTHLDDLRKEIVAVKHDLHLWSGGLPAYDHTAGLGHARIADRSVAVAFTLLREQAYHTEEQS